MSDFRLVSPLLDGYTLEKVDKNGIGTVEEVI